MFGLWDRRGGGGWVGGYEGKKKPLCSLHGPLIVGSLFTISFFPQGICFWFWAAGLFGLCGGGVDPPDPPPPPPPMNAPCYGMMDRR